MEPQKKDNTSSGQPPAQPSKKVVTLRTKMRRRKHTRVIWSRVIILVLFMLMFASVFVVNSEIFEIKHIDVNGCVRVSEERVLLVSGIRKGENMLAFRAGRVKAAIGDIALVRGVSLKRKLPSRILIGITERQPYAYVRGRKVFYMIDHEQVVLEISTVARNNDLRTITSDSVEPAEVGRRLEFPYDSLMISFFDKAEPSLGSLMTSAHFNKNGVKLYLNNGAYVLLGNGDKLRDKLDHIPLLVRSLENAGVPYEGLNLRNLEAATFIKKKTGEPLPAGVNTPAGETEQKDPAVQD